MARTIMNRPNVNEPWRAEIFDVDGTLCDVRTIRHYVAPPNHDFHSFHVASAFCPPNPEVVEWAREARAAGDAVLVVTAREARYRILTRKWLTAWEIPFDGLWTRKGRDFRKDAIVKREILAEIRALGYDPRRATDDNPEVLDVWKDEGLETRIVPGWYEQFGVRT